MISATNDQEYAALERRFNEFQKVVERLEKDAEAFRDAVAGKKKGKRRPWRIGCIACCPVM